MTTNLISICEFIVELLFFQTRGERTSVPHSTFVAERSQRVKSTTFQNWKLPTKDLVHFLLASKLVKNLVP